MTLKNKDQPVNPVMDVSDDEINEYIGLTKREAFAMAAMQGILASKFISDFARDGREISGHNQSCDDEEAISHVSIRYADSLLKELEK